VEGSYASPEEESFLSSGSSTPLEYARLCKSILKRNDNKLGAEIYNLVLDCRLGHTSCALGSDSVIHGTSAWILVEQRRLPAASCQTSYRFAMGPCLCYLFITLQRSLERQYVFPSGHVLNRCGHLSSIKAHSRIPFQSGALPLICPAV
jgi:hypothetical protein